MGNYMYYLCHATNDSHTSQEDPEITKKLDPYALSYSPKFTHVTRMDVPTWTYMCQFNLSHSPVHARQVENQVQSLCKNYGNPSPRTTKVLARANTTTTTLRSLVIVMCCCTAVYSMTVSTNALAVVFTAFIIMLTMIGLAALH